MSKKILLLLLLTILLALTLGSNFQKSLTWDEPIFIHNGIYYLTGGETYNSNQPILSGIVAAAPLVILGIEPLPFDEIDWLFKDTRNIWPYYGNNDLWTITFWSHIGFILFSLIFGYYVYRWAKELYGRKAGLFALFLYTFSATILAWTVSATPDLLSAGLMFIALYYFWKFLCKEKKRNLIYAAVLLGLAVSAKITALFLLPALGLLYLFYRKFWTWKGIKQTGFVFLIFGILSLGTVTLLHVFDAGPLYDVNDPFYQNGIGKEFRTEERLETILDNYISKESPFRPIVKTLVTKVPVPGVTFYQAIYTHSQDSISAGRPSYLLGKWQSNGWWYYYIILLFIKVPLAILIYWLCSLLFFFRTKHKDWRHELVLIAPVIIWLIWFSFISQIDAGIRHLIFIFPLLFVFSGKLMKVKETVWKVIFIILGIWLILSIAFTFPFYTSYFNELVGQENGYLYLAGDNVDVGQDMLHIGAYMEANNLSSIQLHYNGVEDPEYRNLSYELIDCEPRTGLIMISVGALQGSAYGGEYRATGPDTNCFSWLLEEEPIDSIGGSILVYNLTEN